MKWKIELSHSSRKFINKKHIDKNEILEIISLFIKKIEGKETINIDIKK